MKRTVLKVFATILAVCAVLSLCAVFAACDNHKDDGKLYVGLECDYAPFNFKQFDDSDGAVKISNADGYVNGYDVMIAKRVAEALGKELVIRQYEWDSLIPAINAGTLDMVIAGMSPTAERAAAIDFTDAYYHSNLVIVVRKDSQYANATSLADFRGAKIVAQQSTFHDTALQNQGGNYGIIRQTPMGTFPLMINALNSRAVDGYIAEEPGARTNCAVNQNFTYIDLENNVTGFNVTTADTSIAVGVKKGSSLTALVNRALAEISQEERAEMMAEAIRLVAGEEA